MITVITIYLKWPAELEITAIEGRLSAKERTDIARRFALRPGDSVSFCEIEPGDKDHIPKPRRSYVSGTKE